MREFKPFQIRWNEPLGEPECPYMIRWVINLGGFAIRIHHWLRSDDKRFFHDHSWWFISVILRGYYTDVSPSGRDKVGPGYVRFRKAEHKHYVEVEEGGCWSILLTGPPFRHWGFWVDGKFRRPLKYFHKYGHPPCDEQ